MSVCSARLFPGTIIRFFFSTNGYCASPLCGHVMPLKNHRFLFCSFLPQISLFNFQIFVKAKGHRSDAFRERGSTRDKQTSVSEWSRRRSQKPAFWMKLTPKYNHCIQCSSYKPGSVCNVSKVCSWHWNFYPPISIFVFTWSRSNHFGMYSSLLCSRDNNCRP